MKPEFLIGILNNIQGHILVLDRNLKIIFSNDNTSSMIGSDYSKTGIHKNFKNEDQEKLDLAVQKILTAKKDQFESVFEIKDSNSLSWYQFQIKGFDFHSKKYAIIQFKDISENKLKEDTLKECEEKFKDAFNSMSDVFIRTDMNGKCVMVSPSIYQLLGYKQEEILGKDLANFYVDPKKRNKVVETLQKNKSVINLEIDVLRKDGKTITVSANAKMYYNSNGEQLGTESNLRNITKRKKAETQVQEYQKRLKSLALDLIISEERMRKQIAVDLHDNVGQLLSSSRMQLARVIDLEENPELTIRIKNISQALLKTIGATREAIFNLSPPQLNEIGLFAAVEDWMDDQVERKYNIKTSIAGEQEIFQLEENTRFLIFRSIKELIINVVKHARAKRLWVEFKSKKEILEITVQDDGIGFKYDPELFKLKSNAYGLFSIQERMSDLAGSITIDSEFDKGTKVKLMIPLKSN